MQVIAKKNNSYTAYTIMCFSFAILFTISAIILMICFSFIWYAFAMFFVIPIICIPVGIHCFKKTQLPDALIYLDKNKIILYDSTSFTLEQIRDISYKHASSRYGTYSYGTITFVLNTNQQIKVCPVANLSMTGQYISRLVYGNQSSSNQQHNNAR